jgi:glycosyltransferase involved in cell wall biosynthesis
MGNVFMKDAVYKFIARVESGIRHFLRALEQQISRIRIIFSIKHVSGLEQSQIPKDGVVVLCLLRNGSILINDFIEHYLTLGARHIVFLDNGSDDNTIEIAKKYSKVTVLKSLFPFRNGGNMRLREYLTDRWAWNRWSLCVDIDEFFDYPNSEIMSLDCFIKYLEQHGFTAVISQMLDMFPQKIIRGEGRTFRRGEHCYYIINNLIQCEYKLCDPVAQNASSEGTHHTLRGGIRSAMFAAAPLLTKHALIRRSRLTRRNRFGHLLDIGVVADVESILLHYKFFGDFFEHVSNAVREEQYYKASREYKLYHHFLRNVDTLVFPTEKAEVWNSTNKLIEQKVISTGLRYQEWCNSYAGKDKDD